MHITAWVALTDVPVELGAVEVVPGSQIRGQTAPWPTFAEPQIFAVARPDANRQISTATGPS